MNLRWCTSSMLYTSVLVRSGRRGPCWPRQWLIRYGTVACFRHMVSHGQGTTWQEPIPSWKKKERKRSKATCNDHNSLDMITRIYIYIHVKLFHLSNTVRNSVILAQVESIIHGDFASIHCIHLNTCPHQETCHQQRECSAHWPKVGQKCKCLHIWNDFLSQMCTFNLAPLVS